MSSLRPPPVLFPGEGRELLESVCNDVAGQLEMRRKSRFLAAFFSARRYGMVHRFFNVRRYGMVHRFFSARRYGMVHRFFAPADMAWYTAFR